MAISEELKKSIRQLTIDEIDELTAVAERHQIVSRFAAGDTINEIWDYYSHLSTDDVQRVIQEYVARTYNERREAATQGAKKTRSRR